MIEYHKDLSISERTLVAVQAALKAGDLLKSGFGTQFQINSKEGKHNLVTEYDHNSEELIISFIKEHYPEDNFLSEECGHLEKKPSSYEWIIDPLDGTVNFAHGIPMFAVSIGARKDNELILGVVYQPITSELFIAEKNAGAYLNGKELKTSKTKLLSQSILATGFPYNLLENPHHCIERFMEILRMGLPVRRIGVAALDLVYLAAGRFDGFFEVSLAPWDMAAGILIIEEAGGRVSDWTGKPFDMEAKTPIMATNQIIHEELSELLTKEVV